MDFDYCGVMPDPSDLLGSFLTPTKSNTMVSGNSTPKLLDFDYGGTCVQCMPDPMSDLYVLHVGLFLNPTKSNTILWQINIQTVGL